MQVEIITPEKTLYKGEAKLVRVPGSKGCFAILHCHAPIVSTLDPGIIRIVEQDKKSYFELLEPGVIEQHNDRIIILADCIRETHPIESYKL